VRDFQILIVSAVKICKPCLQTASAPPRSSTGTEPHWGLLSPDPLNYNPQMKISGAASLCCPVLSTNNDETPLFFC